LRLKVPVALQPNSYTCVSTSLKMVYDYFNEVLKGDLNLDIDEISKSIGTTEDGTDFDDIEKINSNPKILISMHSVEVIAKYGNYGLSDIENEINNGRPAIAWILPPEAKNRYYEHSVVITGVDRDKYTVYCNDPFHGEKEIKLGEFMSLWSATDRTLIKFKVGKRVQRLLDEWIRELNAPEEKKETDYDLVNDIEVLLK